MKQLIQLFTITFLLIAPIQVANSQSKVAHIDVQQLITDMPEVIAAQKELEKLQKTYTNDIQNTIKELQKNHTIAGYGASGRANMFCNLTDLNLNIVKFIVDESPERCGRYIANTDIPIVDVETLKNSDVDLLIIFAWNYSKMIIEKTQFRKFKYLVAFPKVQVVDTYEELEGFDSI